MTKLVHLLCFAIITLEFCGCSFGQKYDHRLLHADEIMEGFPDLAMRILNNIDTAMLNSRGDKMLFWLLYAQARVKTDNDTVIDLAQRGVIKYFNAKSDDNRLMRALYYNAFNAFLRGDLDIAIADACNSMDFAKKSQDAYWCARNSELIADLYSNSYMHAEELGYRLKEYEYFTECGREVNRLWVFRDLACNYACLGDTAKFYELIDSAIQLSHPLEGEFKFRMVNRFAKLSKYIILVDQNKLEYAAEIEKEVIEINDLYPSATTFNSLAKAETRRRNTESARQYIDKAWAHASCYYDTLIINGTLAELYRVEGNNDKYTESIIGINNYLSKEVLNVLRQSVVVKQLNMKQAELSEARERELRLRVWIVAIIIGVAGLGASGTVFYRSRMRLKNAEIEKQAADVLLLHASLDEERDGHAEKTELVRHLYKEHWETIGRLVKRLKKMEGSAKERDNILKKIDAELRSLADPAMLPKIVAEIDKAYNGGISSLRDNPAINESDAAMAALIVAEIDTTTACRMLGISRNTFYSRRRRLMEKIEKESDKHTSASPVVHHLLTNNDTEYDEYEAEAADSNDKII